jgi:cytidylate kinase
MPTELVHPLLISGKQGSGKTKTADALQSLLTSRGFEVVRYKFAQPLYEMHDMVLAYMAEEGFEVPVKDGLLLQLLGTDWGRAVFGPYVWVKCASFEYRRIRKTVSEYTKPTIYQKTVVFLIDDLRFKTELEGFREDGFTVRLEAARDVRKSRADSWRDNETHQSEVDLDDCLDFFDAVIRTDKQANEQEVAHAIYNQFLSYLGTIYQ